MRNPLPALSTLCCAAAVAWPSVSTAQSDHPQGGDQTSALLLAELQRLTTVPGLSAAYWRDGEIVWAAAVGRRDAATDAPVTSSTRFRLASVSKVIAAVAAWRLAEQGALDLDAPISSYVSGLRSDWQGITIRQLAAHSSGLPHYQDVDAGLGSVAFASGTEALALFRDRELLAPPGARYAYSSWGFVLLSAAIERVTGEAFPDHVERTFLPDAGITRDHASTNDPRYSRAFAFADRSARAVPAGDISYTYAGGGLAANAPDLARFGGAVMTGRLISAAGWQAMQQPFRLTGGNFAGERDYRVGFGWRVGTDGDGAAIAHHAGVTLGARSVLLLWPQERSAIVLLSNAEWVSSIEPTAMLLAAPLRARPSGLSQRPCPIGADTASGTLGADNVRMAVSFRLESGRCRGSLSIAGTPLAERFSASTLPVAVHLPIIDLSLDGTLSRAALVSPFGLYDMRIGTDGRLSGNVAGRRLDLGFSAADRGS